MFRDWINGPKVSLRVWDLSANHATRRNWHDVFIWWMVPGNNTCTGSACDKRAYCSLLKEKAKRASAITYNCYHVHTFSLRFHASFVPAGNYHPLETHSPTSYLVMTIIVTCLQTWHFMAAVVFAPLHHWPHHHIIHVHRMLTNPSCMRQCVSIISLNRHWYKELWLTGYHCHSLGAQRNRTDRLPKCRSFSPPWSHAFFLCALLWNLSVFAPAFAQSSDLHLLMLPWARKDKVLHVCKSLLTTIKQV